MGTSANAVTIARGFHPGKQQHVRGENRKKVPYMLRGRKQKEGKNAKAMKKVNVQEGEKAKIFKRENEQEGV